jgi:serine phosphatase RsbU (regulator of sigma subunit)
VDQLGRFGAVFPLAVIVLFGLLDMAAGPEPVVLGLVVIGPLVAASVTGRWMTAGYAVLAFGVAALLGAHDRLYTAEEWPVQATLLFGVALGGVFAFGVCGARLEREERLRLMSARAAVAERTASLAEALQRSLLAEPPDLPGLEIEVRYLPAAEHVKIGGDWYDAFHAPGDRVVVVVGDVAGHDGGAATTMAQVRNMLRGIAQVLAAPPAVLLTALDRAVQSLSRGVLATVVLVEISGRLLRWSNAGHPPMLLVGVDGAARLLEQSPDLLLGVHTGTSRADHELTLHPGDTVVLFTDGLVEQRGAEIDDGLQRILGVAERAADRPLAELCDELLDHRPERGDDDIALLALRVR